MHTLSCLCENKWFENNFFSELVPDILSQKPKDSDVSQAVVIVDGLPEVGIEKLDKLQNHIKKLFKDCQGGVISANFPVNANNKTKGLV